MKISAILKETELRVGSIIKDEWAADGSGWKITRIIARGYVYGNSFCASLKHLRPVKITPDWLKILHCEPITDIKFFLSTSIGDAYITQTFNNGDKWYANFDGYVTRDFEYVHELQNLILGLTGKAEI